jgi:CelD/BcsL family acetyltransferase involved in cellulose biosynthesis
VTEIRVVESESDFEKLGSSWAVLAEKANVRPFQQFGWLNAWVRTIGQDIGCQILTPTLWDGDALLAVMPLGLRRYKGLRLLEWLGARASDYSDAIVAPGLETDKVLADLWNSIRRRSFDLVRFGQVRSDAAICPMIMSMKPWIETREEAMGIPILWSSGSEWLKSQSASSRESINRRLKRMKKQGFEFHIVDRAESLPAVLDALVAQKREWLAQRDLDGFIATAQGDGFLREVASHFLDNGLLHLSTVRSADAIGASHFGFISDGVLYYYMPTYDARWTKSGFGTALLDSLVMWACDRGLRRLDLLIGDHGYKKRYDVTAEPLQTAVVPNSLMGHMALILYRRFAARKGNIEHSTVDPETISV